MPKNRDFLPWFGLLIVVILFIAGGVSLGEGLKYVSLFLFWAAIVLLGPTVHGFYEAGAYDYTRSTDVALGEYPVTALWRVFPVTHVVLKHSEALNDWHRIYEIQSGLLPPDLKEGDTLVVQRDKFKGRTYTSYRKKVMA